MNTSSWSKTMYLRNVYPETIASRICIASNFMTVGNLRIPHEISGWLVEKNNGPWAHWSQKIFVVSRKIKKYQRQNDIKRNKTEVSG